MNMITYFVLSQFLMVIFKEKSTFKEKLQKKVTKMRHVIIPTHSTRLARATIHERNFFTKMAIIAKNVISECSFLF